MITIFTIPKPFNGHIKVIQTNAIRSWLKLRPSCQIIVFGDEEGIAETAKELGVQHVPDIKRNEFGTPLLDYVLGAAHDHAEHNILCYVNGDIILTRDLLEAICRVQKRRFLVIGQRWDVDLDRAWDFSAPDWETQLRMYVAKTGRVHPPTGIDYFVFPRGQYRDIPPFAVGRAGWDNWMIYHSRSRLIPVIDATRAVTAVHQNHDYSHHSGGKAGVWEGPEARDNLDFAGGYQNLFTLRDATWSLDPKGLRPALTMWHVHRHMDALPILYPGLSPGMRLGRTLMKKLWRTWNFVRGD